jgi:hypothetical protein
MMMMMMMMMMMIGESYLFVELFYCAAVGEVLLCHRGMVRRL